MAEFGVSACPACGLHISSRKELPFLTRRIWRENVAEKLGYNKDFILNFGQKTRIHRHHFHEYDIRDNKPIGKSLFYLITKFILMF